MLTDFVLKKYFPKQTNKISDRSVSFAFWLISLLSGFREASQILLSVLLHLTCCHPGASGKQPHTLRRQCVEKANKIIWALTNPLGRSWTLSRVAGLKFLRSADKCLFSCRKFKNYKLQTGREPAGPEIWVQAWKSKDLTLWGRHVPPFLQALHLLTFKTRDIVPLSGLAATSKWPCANEITPQTEHFSASGWRSAARHALWTARPQKPISLT